MAAAGLKIDDSWVAMAQPTVAVSGQALGRMLGGPNVATALFCGNNRISVLVLRELNAIGRSLALVGFDDFELAELVVPGITVVAHDVTEMGRAAAGMLLRRIAGETGPAKRIELRTRLIPRGSGEIAAQDQTAVRHAP